MVVKMISNGSPIGSCSVFLISSTNGPASFLHSSHSTSSLNFASSSSSCTQARREPLWFTTRTSFQAWKIWKDILRKPRTWLVNSLTRLKIRLRSIRRRSCEIEKINRTEFRNCLQTRQQTYWPLIDERKEFASRKAHTAGRENLSNRIGASLCITFVKVNFFARFVCIQISTSPFFHSKIGIHCTT